MERVELFLPAKSTTMQRFPQANTKVKQTNYWLFSLSNKFSFVNRGIERKVRYIDSLDQRIA